jgi:hypothetical protein
MPDISPEGRAAYWERLYRRKVEQQVRLGGKHVKEIAELEQQVEALKYSNDHLSKFLKLESARNLAARKTMNVAEKYWNDGKSLGVNEEIQRAKRQLDGIEEGLVTP